MKLYNITLWCRDAGGYRHRYNDEVCVAAEDVQEAIVKAKPTRTSSEYEVTKLCYVGEVQV